MGQHVLIIEDEMLIALELEALLMDLGFSTFDIAATADQALACATTHRPDLITADFRIVGGTGIEAIEGIIAALGLVPVIYITGNVEMVAGRGAPIVDKPVRACALAAACVEARLVA